MVGHKRHHMPAISLIGMNFWDETADISSQGFYTVSITDPMEKSSDNRPSH